MVNAADSPPGDQPSIDGSAAGDSADMASAPMFSVLVAEGDQRDMTLEELVGSYNSGLVTADTFVWADGQPDWMALGQIPVIVEALNAASAAVDAQATAAAQAPEQAAPLKRASGNGKAAAFQAPTEPVAAAPAASFFGGSAATPAPAAVAAVREERRGGVDLFGARPQTTSDEEVATSAPAMDFNRPKLTGQRDEQSVLFSLSALTAQAQAAQSSTSKSKDDSGLIDLRALADKAAQPAAPAGAPPLAILDHAPALGLPGALDPSFSQLKASEPPPAKSNKGMIIGIGIAVAGLALAAAIVVVAISGKTEAPAAAAPTQPTEVEPPPPPVVIPAAATGSNLAAAPATGTAGTEEEPPKAGSTAKKTGTGKVGGPLPKKTSETTAGGAPPPATAAPPPKKSGGCGCPPGDLACAMACAVK